MVSFNKAIEELERIFKIVGNHITVENVNLILNTNSNQTKLNLI